MGNMGGVLASALVNAGFKLTIWNRTADRPQVKSLVEAGAVYESRIGRPFPRVMEYCSSVW